MSVLDDAIRIGAKYPVFPCRADKKPCSKHGFKDAVQEPSAIVNLWRDYPGVLIGVPTGDVSGIDVLDIDPRHGGMDWLNEARDSLPVTRIHHTRSGGYHFLFEHAEPVRNSAGKIAPGVDTRGTGGYCIWWPSHGCKTENADIIDTWPRWLLTLLSPPKTYRYIEPATKVEADMRAVRMIERAYDRVRTAPAGQRHYHLRAAAATLGGLTRFTGKTLAQIEHDLVSLIMQTGAEDQKNAEKTARWALEKGCSSPLLNGR